MKVAIAGSGPVARYLIEELGAGGHDIVQLTRSVKPNQKSVEQRQTDYSVFSLLTVLEDRDAIVSTVADFSSPRLATKVHLDMLEACRQSPRTKIFIPSEWTANIEEHPEQPMFLVEHNKVMHEALKVEKDIKWTMISNSWFSDYVLPQNHRYLRDLDQLWPMDYKNKIFTIYGPGSQPVNFVFVRDVAKAVAALLDSKEPWEPYTYISAEQLTWNDLFAIIKKSDPEWTGQKKPLAETIRLMTDQKSPENNYIGHFEILSYSGASTFPQEKVERDWSKHFQGVHLRTVEEVLLEVTRDPNHIV